jgi:3D (Asp-Asp-Asp) domain-containing protein
MGKLLAHIVLCLLLFLSAYHPPPAWASRQNILKSSITLIDNHISVTVTMYAPGKSKMGRITASGQACRRGVIALSKDLEKKWGLKFGDVVEVVGLGTFSFQDRMHPKWLRKVDIWVPSEREANTFGKRPAVLVVLKKNKPSGEDDA